MVNDRSDEVKLELCPHCGNSPQQCPQNSNQMQPLGRGWMQFIWCENCDAQGPLRETEAEAIAAWNRRPPRAENAQGAEAVAVPLSYSRIIEIVEDCSERMKRGGESHRMFAKWVSEGINAALASPPAPQAEVTEALAHLETALLSADPYRHIRAAVAALSIGESGR